MNLYPINFTIPEEIIVDQIPQKDKDFSSLIPGNLSTYIYQTQEEYYQEYQRSYYAFTWKKCGWDCLRHYEILACGCIPYFVNLENCPEKIMTFLPKKLIIEAMNIEGVENGKINHDIFDKQKYFEILSKLLEHTRKFLTVNFLAKYIILKLNYPPQKILMLNGDIKPDYQRCLLAIGLRRVYKQKFIDYPKISHLYKSYTNEKNIYGKGFTYSKRLEDEDIDRNNIEEKIKNKYFDLIIYGGFHRGLLYHELVCKKYHEKQIIYICGVDCHPSYGCKLKTDVNGIKFLREYI